MLKDSFGRAVDYLRLSVTDRCNLRCLYCLPERGVHSAPSQDRLTDAEVLILVRCFAGLGFSGIRVTGGEPLVREGIAGLVAGIARTPGVSDVSLSTNGLNLAGLARDLKAAGLSRVNVSLDSLDPGRFRRIARHGDIQAVLSGIEAALSAGLSPVKVNVVVARGMNDDDIPAFVRWTEREPIHVRFIELMPMGETGFFSEGRRVPLDEMLERAAPLVELPDTERPAGRGPARYRRRPGARGTVGFISALSRGFCASCNRVRLTAQGLLSPCLDSTDGTDLRGPLRAGAADSELRGLIARAVSAKPERHAMAGRAGACAPNPRFMCQVGG